MDSKNNRLVLIILSIICVFLIAITSVKDAWIAPVRAGVGYILLPIQNGVNTVGSAIYNNITQNRNIDSLTQENASLKAQVAALTAENTKLEANSFELERLRDLYKLDNEYGEYDTIGARIIAKDTKGWFRVFRIDKGSNDGIKTDMNIIADGGLVGIVTDVGANYATVRAIIDDISRVSAKALQTGDNCIVAGDMQLYEDGKLKLSDIMADADIKDGDKIVTSNISSKYLPNILIGYASDISVDNNRLTKSGYLIPVASFDDLQEVLVITQLKADYNEDDNN